MSVPVRPSSRARRWLRRGLLAAAAAALVLLLVLAWVLRSDSGREFALARVLAALPPGSLSWQRAEGTISGPLQFHGLRYEQDGLRVEAERVLVDLAPAALIGRTLRIEQLTIERGRVELPAASESREPWPSTLTLPEQLPSLRSPLAVAVEALAIRDVRIAQGELQLIALDTLDAIGRLERGRLTLQRFDIASDRGRLQARGSLDSASRWDTGLQASLALAQFGAEPLPMQIDAAGDLDDLTLVVTTALPEPAKASLRVVGGLTRPRWTLDLAAPGIEPARLGIDAPPLALELEARGDLAHATLSGIATIDGRALRLMPSTLRYADGSVLVEPFAVQLEPGSIEANGSIDLRAASPMLALDLRWQDLEWTGTAPADTVRTRGTARVEGATQDYRLDADAELVRGRERAQLTLRGRGDTTRMTLDQFDFIVPQGELDASGEIAWSPDLRWDLRAKLRDFDPAWLQPDYAGAIDAELVTTGRMIDDRPSGRLTLDPLGGTLRERALDGRIEASLDEAGHGEATFDLGIGGSRVRGTGQWGERIDAQLQFAPLQLEDLLSQASGRIGGTLAVRGSRAHPSLIADLEGEAIVFADVQAQRLRLSSRGEGNAPRELDLRAEQVRVADQNIAMLRIDAEGDRAEHVIDVSLQAEVATLSARLRGGAADGVWRGELQALDLTPHERDAWRLDAPSHLSVDTRSGTLELDSSCLRAGAASLCTAIAWQATRGEASFRLDALPLQTFDPIITQSLQTPASAYGEVSADGQLRRAADGAMSGDIRLRSAAGGLRLDPESPRDLLVYRNLQLDGRLDPARAELSASAELGGEGELRATLVNESPLTPDGALQGEVLLTLRDLAFVELLSDQVADVRGRLDAGLNLAGTRAQPALLGRATLTEFTAELPALGVALREGRADVRSEGAGAARIEASVRSGEGELRVAGRLDGRDEADARLQLAIEGENFAASATPDLAAIVSPDLQLRLVEERIELRGELALPRARINLERLESATRPSSDVVIVDAQSAAQKATVLDSEIVVELGEDVRLVGFGLKGKLEGRVTLRERPGRASTARGGVRVSGEYKAYGQDLRITRGQLSYASTPLDNPALDLRAEREIDEITVGVQVRGTALAPQLSLWSDPSLDQAEQLSYLVLGRPLRSASQADGSQLSQAAAAFGGNLLAQQLGARMGLDEVGVADSRALGGAALTLGKYLSPRLYVSYGVALFGTGQVVTFKYLLSRIWSVQIDSGSENRAAVNYRLER